MANFVDPMMRPAPFVSFATAFSFPAGTVLSVVIWVYATPFRLTESTPFLAEILSQPLGLSQVSLLNADHFVVAKAGFGKETGSAIAHAPTNAILTAVLLEIGFVPIAPMLHSFRCLRYIQISIKGVDLFPFF